VIELLDEGGEKIDGTGDAAAIKKGTHNGLKLKQSKVGMTLVSEKMWSITWPKEFKCEFGNLVYRGVLMGKVRLAPMWAMRRF
jgi:hypothetical protein